MKIKSNTKGKMEKILGGKVFKSQTVFITELIQNSQRAKATCIKICCEGDSFKMSDNGTGLKDPQSLLTFDMSSWESTDEGFGIGFFSILGTKNFKSARIVSNEYEVLIDSERIKDLDVDVRSIAQTDGFEVTIHADFDVYTICDEVRKVGKFIEIPIYLNGSRIEQMDLFDTVKGIGQCTFENRMYEAKLIPSEYSYNNPTVYYENRKVGDFYGLRGVEGIIKLKKNAVNLREPDRNQINEDDKYYKMKKLLKQNAKEMYMKLIKEQAEEEDVIDKFADSAQIYLEPKDYKNILTFAGLEFNLLDELKAVAENEKNSILRDKKMLEILRNDCETWESVDTFTSDNIRCRNLREVYYLDSCEIFECNDKIYYKTDLALKKAIENKKKDSENNKTITSVVKAEKIAINSPMLGNGTKNTKAKTKIKINDLIDRKMPTLWYSTRRADMDTYMDNIQLAEYYGIKVLKAKNKLFENVFKYMGLPHISCINDVVQKRYNFSNCFSKNNKEDLYIKLLSPILKLFNIKENIFKIGDVEEQLIFTFNGKERTVKSKNTKGNITIAAVTTVGVSIIFDRKAINLKAFQLSDFGSDVSKIGKGDIKCLLYNIETIAHELAHYLYNTVDNTVEHYKYQNEIQTKIVNYYLA